MPPSTPRALSDDRRRPARGRRIARALGAAAILLGAPTASASGPDPKPPEAYALDAVERQVSSEATIECPTIDLVDYRGDVVRYQAAGKVNRDFRERLLRFERVAVEVGTEVYGRAPVRVVQLGTYNCRRMRIYKGWLSEHALGNAIDVAGFDFGHLPKGAALPAGLDKVFANGFEVRVGRHWGKTSGHAAVHARFLQTLAQRLVDRPDVFRVLLGPGYPGHANHFHFDMSRFKLVQIFADGQPLAPSSP